MEADSTRDDTTGGEEKGKEGVSSKRNKINLTKRISEEEVKSRGTREDDGGRRGCLMSSGLGWLAWVG